MENNSIKKIDGTYCLKDEFSGYQKGHFLTKDKAIKECGRFSK